jgi:hypothetical protein
MTLDLTDAEREFLHELLAENHTTLLKEIHRTDRLDFKRLLERRLEVLEGLREKLANVPAGTAAG